MEAYDIRESLDEFSAAREQFEAIIGALESDEMMGAEHGEVEKFVFEDGFELLRRLFQGHLDRRSAMEPLRESVKGCDRVERTHRREGCTRSLESIFGEVTVIRVGYSYPGYESLFPLDAELNLPPGKYSHGLQSLLGDEASKGAFDEAVATVRKLTGGQVPKRQVLELMPGMAVDFDAFYVKRQLDGPEETDDLLVMSTDGKGVVMREGSLREHTQRAAEKEREKSGEKKSGRLKPGQKPNRKRMATVTAVYSVAPYVRTPEEVMDVLETAEGEEPPDYEQKRPRPENKRVAASLEKDPKQVIDEMFAEAERRDPEHLRTWSVVVDGAEHQLRLIKQALRFCEVDVTIVVDIVHVSEYLWKAAHGFYPVGSKEAEEWVAEKMIEVLRGNAGQVAGGMRRSATKRGLGAQKRKNIDECADYLLKYKDYLHYDEYLAAGLPIGSGVIEGACRYLVKDRMEITGARWGLENAEAVLKLRALRTSGDFDEYWNFHRSEEQKRHHRSRYAFTHHLEVVK
jgi:hypothetical protein